MRENREVPRSPAVSIDASSWMVRGVGASASMGREGNAEAVSPR
jgi:hypothetical protein